MRKGKIFLNILANNKLYTLLIVLLTLVYWQGWIGGVRVATDFPVVSLSDLKNQLNFPYVWFSRGSIGLGGYSVFTLWSWPMDFVAGILSNLGFNFGILERIMFIIPTLLLGTYGILNLLAQYNLSKTSKFIATFFYLSNTYILLLIDGGQLGIGLAYSMLPISYFLFVKSINGKLKDKVVSGLGLWILGFFDIRFIYVLGILLAFRFVFFGWTSGWIKSGLVSVIIFLGLNIYWILPLIKSPLSSSTFSGLTQTSNLNFTQFKHAISLLQPHWYQNIFGKIAPFRKEFLLIPIVAFLAVVLNRKKREVWFWTLIALIAVFLTKGSNPPLPHVYNWLFTHIPGFSLFRDSTKFFFLVALSYSVLIAFTTDEIVKRFPRLKNIFPVCLILFFLFLIRPVFLGQMTGTFSKPNYETSYSLLADKLSQDKDFGRILWLPSKNPLGFSSPIHSSLEGYGLENLRPFAVATVGAYETQNFIREGNYMGELFDITGIKYIAYPSLDPKRDDMSQEKTDYYFIFLNQISKLPWIANKFFDSPVPVFETKKHEDKFFLAENTYFIVGSDRVYQNIQNLGQSFSNNALIFVEENKEVINRIDNMLSAKIVLYDKTLTDLALSFSKTDNSISPSFDLDFSPNKSGWWKREASDLIWFRDFLQQKYGIDNLDFDYGNGWAIAEGNIKLQISNDKLQKGKILFARVMNSSKSGNLEFWQGDKKIGEIITKIEKPEKITIKFTGDEKHPDIFSIYDKADFHWVRVGELATDKNLTIKSRGDINIVNSLVVISKQDEEELTKKTETLKQKGKIINWKDAFKGENKAQVSYTQLSNTHYKIKIQGLSYPTTLFFSEMFDSNWELNSQPSFKLYSLLNGFWVDQNGEYDLYFKPQKYVLPGLLLSIVVLTSCIMFLTWKRSKKSS
jgi:hypothetical protein